MTSLKKYFVLMKKHPGLFQNTGEKGEIEIITDYTRIRAEQAYIREKLRADGKPDCWIDIGILSEDSWFWVVRDMVKFPNGKIGGYIRYINRRSQEGGFNVVLLCLQGNQVLLIKRFRHEERSWLWEFPRGFGELGLTAEENARHELEEEVGLKPSELVKLSVVAEGDGGTAAFLAKIPEGQQFQLDEGEAISDARWVEVSEFEQYIVEGKINDLFTLWAYTLAKIKKVV